jgi:hypothetical protein
MEMDPLTRPPNQRSTGQRDSAVVVGSQIRTGGEGWGVGLVRDEAALISHSLARVTVTVLWSVWQSG